MSCDKALYIKNVPMNAVWEIEEAYCFDTKDLTINDLKGKYFLIYNASGTKFAPWFDDGVVSDPVVSGATLVPIDISAATTPALIAQAMVDDITGTSYDVSRSGTEVRAVYSSTAKISTAGSDGTAGVLLSMVRSQIGGSIDLGLLDGEVSFDPSIEAQDITAHQSGGIILGQNITSVGGSISLTLKEYSPARYREIFESIGGKVATTSVTGFGSAMVGKNLLGVAKRLVLHPVYKAAGDLTENYTFWKAVPELGAITFSGEAPNTLPLEFTAFIDNNQDSAVNVWAFGDISTLP